MNLPKPDSSTVSFTVLSFATFSSQARSLHSLVVQRPGLPSELLTPLHLPHPRQALLSRNSNPMRLVARRANRTPASSQSLKIQNATRGFNPIESWTSLGSRKAQALPTLAPGRGGSLFAQRGAWGTAAPFTPWTYRDYLDYIEKRAKGEDL